MKPVHNTCRRAGHRTPHTCLGVPQAPLLQPRQQQHPGKQLSYTARRKGCLIVAPAHGLGRCDIGGHLNTLTSLNGLHSVPHDLTHVQAESAADTPKQSIDPDVTLQLEEQHRTLSTHTQTIELKQTDINKVMISLSKRLEPRHVLIKHVLFASTLVVLNERVHPVRKGRWSPYTPSATGETWTAWMG